MSWQWLGSLPIAATYFINSLGSRNTQSQLAEQQQQTQLKLECLRIAHQSALEQDRQAFQAKLAGLNQQQAREIEEFRQSVQWALKQQDIDFQRWRFEREKELQQELAQFNRATQLSIAAYQRETTLQLPEVNKLFENWPLRIVPSLILDSHHGERMIPLRILISPPDVDFDRFSNAASSSGMPKAEKRLSQGLRQFLETNYPLESRVRPTELLDGAWDSNRYHGGSSIKALFSMLKSEPALILESELDGDYLNFRIAYWSLGSSTYSYKTIISGLPYREIVYNSAKARAIAWKPHRDRLVSQGKNPKAINELDTHNLEVLEEEEDLKQSGFDISKLPRRYKVNNEDFEALFQFLITCHCLVAGWIADIYYLVHADVPPLLPELLPELTRGIADPQIIQTIVAGYQEVYKALEEERASWVPELALQLARSLANLPDQSWAREQVDYAIRAWLKLRGVPQLEGIDPLEAMMPLVDVDDETFLENLRECLVALETKSE